MSRLEELREGLYRPGPEREPPPPASPRRREPPLPRSWEEPSPRPRRRLLEQAYFAGLRERRRARRVLLGVGVSVLFGLAAFIGYRFFLAPSPVRLELIGPGQVTAGEPVTLTVRIVNRSGVTLREGSLGLTFPEGALPRDPTEGGLGPLRQKIALADIPPGGELLREVQARLLGALGERETVSVLYLYRPENIQGKLTRSAELSLAIVRVPLVVTVDGPSRVASGQEIQLAIGVDAELSLPIPDLTLGVEFPPGFTLGASDPPLADPTEPRATAEPWHGAERTWSLGPLAAGTSQKVTLQGRLEGEPGEAKAFAIRVGRYQAATRHWLPLTEAQSAPTIASPLLLAKTRLNGERQGTLAPGVRVEGSVAYRSSADEEVGGLNVAVVLPERLVDLASVRAERGFYDVSRRAIVWNPASEPRLRALAPGEEGTLGFSFTLRSALPIQRFSDRNFTFPVETRITAAIAPAGLDAATLESRDRIEFKLASALHLAARAAYHDSPVPNRGPLPPQVRRETTYTLFLQLTNGANDHRDVEVRAILPGGVRWLGSVAADLGEITFSEATGELRWRIRELPASSGILRPPVSAAFQLALTPAENQAGSSAVLLKDITAGGQDAFTGSAAGDVAPDLTIELRGDPRSRPEEWRVVP